MADSDFAKKASDVDSPCHGEEGEEEKKRGREDLLKCMQPVEMRG